MTFFLEQVLDKILYIAFPFFVGSIGTTILMWKKREQIEHANDVSLKTTLSRSVAASMIALVLTWCATSNPVATGLASIFAFSMFVTFNSDTRHHYVSRYAFTLMYVAALPFLIANLSTGSPTAFATVILLATVLSGLLLKSVGHSDVRALVVILMSLPLVVGVHGVVMFLAVALGLMLVYSMYYPFIVFHREGKLGSFWKQSVPAVPMLFAAALIADLAAPLIQLG